MEAKDFDKQLLERSYRELIKLTKELNMTKRIKAKKGHLRGAAWHAAREAKASQKQVDKLPPWADQKAEPPSTEIASPTWVSLSDAKPGLNVMKGIFNGELHVVRVHKTDRGVDVIAQVFTPDKSQVHVLIAEQAQFQKIKE